MTSKVTARHHQPKRIIMRSPIAVLAFLAWFTTAGLAQDATKLAEGAISTAAPAGEEAMEDVDPAVLARCRQQAADQKLKDGPDRTAFMGTCVTPED